MEIVIKRSIQNELDCFKTKIKLMAKSLRFAIVTCILGILAIMMCQNDFGVTESSLLCYVVLEFIFFSVSYIVFKRIYLQRKAYKDFSKTALTDYGHLETYSTLTIDNSFFVYESQRKYYKYSWSSFLKFERKDGLIILFIADGYNTAFIIRQSELSVEQFNDLYYTVSQNIQSLKVNKK